ncbi:MAG: chloride channel protein [Gemmatimonadales bacterium]
MASPPPSPDPQSDSWTRRAWAWLDQFRQRENQLALLMSLVIGALVGLVVVAFILLTGRLAARMYPAGGSGYRRLLMPILGALGTGYLIQRFFPDARGSGIPQTKAALFIHDGRISLKTVLGKFFNCSASLASGIALGREGPSVQIGSGLASVIGRRLGLTRDQVKALVPVGGSAALAAAFNTPIAAVLFSLEEIMGDLHAPVLGSVVLSSATSWMVLHLLLGDEPLFHVAGYHLVNPVEFGAYALLGVVGGLGSAAFVKLLLNLRRRFMTMPARTRWWQPAIGGLLVGLMGLFLPEVLGVGYDTVEKALNGDLILRSVLLLAALKIIASATCYASGNAGGIFGPSLFIGAMLGAAVGQLAHLALPAYTAGPGAYALVGMGAVFAGIIRTPLTSVIMIFEVTRDYTIIVPLMIANLIAFFISYRLQREPIYEALALQDGLHLPTAVSRDPTGHHRVTAAIRPSPVLLAPDVPVAEAWNRIRQYDLDTWPVVDRSGLCGVVRRQVLAAAAERAEPGATVAGLLETAAPAERDSQFPHLHPDHSLSLALERMGSARRNALPVVSRGNVRELLGVVTLEDVLKAYGVEESAAGGGNGD